MAGAALDSLRLRDTLTTQLAALTDMLQGDPDPKLVRQTAVHVSRCTCTSRPVRPLPEDDDVFETVWRQYRENGNVF